MEKFNLTIIFPIIIILIFLFSLTFGVVSVWPKYLELKSLNDSIEAKKEELKFQGQYFSELEQIKKELKNYESELAKIDSVLPQDAFPPSLFNFIQTAASQSGLVFKGMSLPIFSSSQDQEKFKEAQFSVDVSGAYSSLKNFLFVLEKCARLFEVENISFSAPKEGEIYTFNLKIKVYSY